MAKMATAKFDRGFDNFQRFIRDLATGRLRRTANQALWSSVNKIAAMVRARYRDMDRGKTTSLTYRFASMGKEKGAINLPRGPLADQDIGLEIFARNVIIEKGAKGGYLIRIDPRAVHPTRGLPLALLAHWSENPVTIIISGSFWTFVYTMLIQQNRGGYGTRKRDRHMPEIPNWRGTKAVTPDAKPVWSFVAKNLIKPTLMKLYSPEIARRLRKMAVAYGAIAG